MPCLTSQISTLEWMTHAKALLTGASLSTLE